jgi:hypothetical protein
MTTGFIQRFKGKIKFAEAYGDFASATKGLFDSGSGGRMGSVWSQTGAPTNGTSGTFAKYALPGDLLVTAEPALYQNTGTQASPTWTAAPLTGAAGITSGTISGVTIDNSAIGGTTKAAGGFTTLLASGLLTLSDVATGITAHSGGGQSSAFALTHFASSVDTVAAGNDSVKLPASGAGKTFLVLNNAASNSMQVYGTGSDTINGVTASTGVAQAAGKLGLFYCFAAGNYARLLSA